MLGVAPRFAPVRRQAERIHKTKGERTVAVGKEIGTFDMTSTSVTLEPGKGDFLTAHINFDGNATGELASRVLATMTVESRNGRDGNYRICARCFLDDGAIMDVHGEGKTVLDGTHNWSVAGITAVAGHRGWAVQGKIDLANGRFTGKLFKRT